MTTFNGAEAYERTAKSELFLAAISDFGGEATFYESADNRSDRIARLTQDVAVQDIEWLTQFTKWLREEANMRTISLTIALEGAKALNKAGIPGGRKLVSGAIRRADEAGEALAYWMAKNGRKIPSAVKRGIADGAIKSFNQYSLAKYDTASHGFRFGDVIELVHPSPKDSVQSDLFKFALDRRRDASAEPSESLVMLQKRKEFLALSGSDKRKLVDSGLAADVLAEAGLTWEVLGSTIEGGMDAKAWEAVIPSMGYMALLRNLRNFEEKGVSEAVLAQVAARIADPAEVAKSRQLPFRFLAAYYATMGIDREGYDSYYGHKPVVTGSLRFAFPLEQALKASLGNVPSLKGKTLILVDRSGSMWHENSKNTKMNFADSAAIFGAALALRAEDATLVQYGDTSEEIKFNKNASVLSLIDQFKGLGGTATGKAMQTHYNSSDDRVILITDEQANGFSGWGSRVSASDVVSANTPLYTFNLVGYKAGAAEKANRVTLGGLTDQSFKLIPLLEAGRDAGWPWETK
jgi:hypothetical protein